MRPRRPSSPPRSPYASSTPDDGAAKVGQGSGGMGLLRAEKTPATSLFLRQQGGLGDLYRGTLPESSSGLRRRHEQAGCGPASRHLARHCQQDHGVLGVARLPAREADHAAEAGWLHRGNRRLARRGSGVPRKQRHTAKRTLDRLRAEHDFKGGYTIIKDYVRERGRQFPRVIGRCAR